MKYIIGIIGCVCVFLGSNNPIVAQNNAPNLNELVSAALRKDYNLANQNLEIGITNVELKELKEHYLPKVSVDAKEAFVLSSFRVNSSEINIPQLNIDIQQGSNTYTLLSSLTVADIGASLLLYSGGKIEKLQKAAAAKIVAQTWMLEQSKEDIISAVIKTYDQLALLKWVEAVLQKSAIRLNENMKTADKALGYGLITKYDYQKIEVAQAQLSSQQQDYAGKKELLTQQLFLLTDIDTERISTLTNGLEPLSVTMEGSFENKAELKALDAQALALKYKIEAEKTWFIPKIQAGASIGYVGMLGGHISSSGPIVQGGDKLSSSLPNVNILPMVNVGIGLKWDVFDGKAGKRAVQKAQMQLSQSENDKKETEEKLALNLVKCKTDYTTALQKIQLSKTQVQSAFNALDQATKEFKTGLIKSSQLIEAINDYQQAQLSQAQTIFEQRRAAINLLKATGNLNETTIPKEF